MSRTRILAVLLLATVAGARPPVAVAQSSGAQLTQDEIIERQIMPPCGARTDASRSSDATSAASPAESLRRAITSGSLTLDKPFTISWTLKCR